MYVLYVYIPLQSWLLQSSVWSASPGQADTPPDLKQTLMMILKS